MKAREKNVRYSRVDEEFCEEENEQLIRNRISKRRRLEKKRKRLKRNIIRCCIIVILIIGAVGIYKNYFSEEAKYKKELKNAFNVAQEKLEQKLNRHATYGRLRNEKIEYIYFEESPDVPLLKVFYEGQDDEIFEGYAVFSVLENYYNSLVSAEESGNILTYINCLNDIFENMDFEYDRSCRKQDMMYFVENTPENATQINQLLALDIENENVVRQIGFLPFNIDVLEWNKDNETGKLNYTYKIHGISYCETVNPSTEDIKQNSSLVIESNYNKNKVKAYYRNITFSSSVIMEEGLFYNKNSYLSKVIWHYVAGNITSEDLNIETTLFEDCDLFDNYIKMYKGDFDFKK